MLAWGSLYGRQRRLPYWILTPSFILYALCPMPFSIFNLHSTICNPFSLLFIVIVPVIGIWPVRMPVSHGSMFVPVTVVNGPRHPGKHVIVMPVIMPMPVLMCSGFMPMQMPVSFEEKESQGYNDDHSGDYLGQRDRFPKESCGHDDPKEWRTGEDDLTSSGTKFMRRSDV
jgi:hypothetical protein